MKTLGRSMSHVSRTVLNSELIRRLHNYRNQGWFDAAFKPGKINQQQGTLAVGDLVYHPVELQNSQLFSNCKLGYLSRSIFSVSDAPSRFLGMLGSKAGNDNSSSESDCDETEPGVNTLEADDISLTTYYLLRTLQGSRRGDDVVAIVNQWISEGHPHTKNTLVCAVTRLRWLSRYKDALQISELLMTMYCNELELMDYVTRLDLIAKVQGTKAAEVFFSSMPTYHQCSDVANRTLLQNYVNKGCVFLATAQMKRMKTLGLLNSPFAYNQMILLYKAKHKLDRVPSLLDDMKELDISPDMETYKILMDIHIQNKDVDSMDKLLNEIVFTVGIKPDSGLLCKLAEGYMSAGSIEKAKDIMMDILNDEEFRRVRKSHDTLIKLFSQLGKAKQVEKIWALRKKFAVVSNDSYTCVIDAFGRVGAIDKAEYAFEELANSRAVQAKHFNHLLHVYAENGDMCQAQNLVSKMLERGCKPNGKTYHYLILGYLKRNSLEKAMKTLKQARLYSGYKDSRPCFETMLLVLEIHAERGDVMHAEDLFQDMKLLNYTQSVEVFNALLKAYVKASKHAYHFLQRLAADKVKPNEETMRLLEQMKPVLYASDIISSL